MGMFQKDIFWQMLVANEFAFINVSIYVRIMIKALKLTLLPNCRSYSLNFMFWKFYTWSKLLASKLQTKTCSQELLSGEVWIMNNMFMSVEREEANFSGSVVHWTLFGQVATEKGFLNFFFFLFDLAPEDIDLAGSAAVGRVQCFLTNFACSWQHFLNWRYLFKMPIISASNARVNVLILCA